MDGPMNVKKKCEELDTTSRLTNFMIIINYDINFIHIITYAYSNHSSYNC